MKAYLSLCSVGYVAEAQYSGNEYRKWVSPCGSVIIGSLPDDDMPSPSLAGKQPRKHAHDGRTWEPQTLRAFAQLS